MNLFPEPAERAKAMGIYGFVVAGSGSIGVLLGGFLTNALNWHWVFLVNLPVGVSVFVLSLILPPPGRGPATAARLDITGAVTFTASLMLAAAAALLAIFHRIEGRVRSPLMPLGLFRLRN